MKRTALSVSVMFALLGLSLARAQTAKPADTDPAEWVPADAVLYVGIHDVAGVWEAFQKTTAYRLLQDPAAAEAQGGLQFVGPLVDKLRARVAKTLGVEPEQLKNPLRGPLAMYMALAPGKDGKDLEPRLVAGVGDAALAKQYYDQAVAKLSEIRKHTTETAGPHTIDVFVLDESKSKAAKEPDKDEFDAFDEPPGPRLDTPEAIVNELFDDAFSTDALPKSMAMCLTADRLAVGGSAEAVQAMLRNDKSGATLAESEDYRALLAALKPVGPVRLVANLPRIIEISKADVPDSEQKDVEDVLRIVGAENLRSLVGHFDIAGDGYDTKLELLFLTKKQRTGMLKVLSLENGPVTPAKTVPADACIYSNLRLSIPPVIDQIEHIVAETDKEAAEEFRTGLENARILPGAEPVNLRKDVLAHLVGPLTFTFRSVKAAGQPQSHTLLTIGHREQAALTSFLKTLADNGLLIARDTPGTPLFDSTFPPGLSVVATGEQVLMGNTPAVQSATEACSADSLAASAAWQRAARLVPEQAWFTLYLDERRLLSAALDLAGGREDVIGTAGPDVGTLLLSTMFAKLIEDADEEGIRKARELLKYSSQMIVTVATVPEGLRFTQVELKPE